MAGFGLAPMEWKVSGGFGGRGKEREEEAREEKVLEGFERRGRRERKPGREKILFFQFFIYFNLIFL
ncbi:MAG: hypothetical protein Q8807_03640 ['Waltheria sp.' little leaf phytoplasma]|nr:hypothetical protein ['Waltheria sp.' little leaf phytoplasma]